MGSEKNELGFRDEHGLALTNLMHGVGIGASLAKDLFLAYQMIVGTRFNGGADVILSELNPGEKVSLVREPDNPYDKRAIMVIDEDERKVGYIPRHQNSILSSLMDAGKYVYGIVAEPRERDVPPSQGGTVWIKLYMREYAMPDDLSIIPRQGARGSFAVVKLWTDIDDDGKESLCGISAIKVINGEEKGIFHCALHEVGEDDDILAVVNDSKALVERFYEFAGFLPLVSHEWDLEVLDELKERYGVLLGKPFSNFLVDTAKMAMQHYRFLNDTDIDSVLEHVEIKRKKYAGDLPSCHKILALYREMEEVDKRRERENSEINQANSNLNDKSNNKSSEKWKTPEKNGRRIIAELKYAQPGNWRFREYDPPSIGCYYYPYENNKDGMLWVSCRKNNTDVSGELFDFNSFILGLCNSEENIVSLSDVEVAGIFAKKVRYFTDLSAETRFECIAIIFATDEYIYYFFFGEKNSLSNEMIAYADEFIADVELLNSKESALAEEYYQKGHAYHHGDGVQRDYVKAAQWYEKAVALGHGLASNNLGVMLFYGNGVPMDRDRGISLMLYAAERGSDKALENVGRFYRDGKYLEKDVKKALELFKKADEIDDGTGAYLIALMYQDGDLEQNFKLANEWYRRALGKGFVKAAFSLGMNIRDGKGEMQDYKLAKTYFDLATASTDINTSSAAFMQIALLYLDGKGVERNLELAKQFCLKSAENRTALVCYTVAAFFEDDRVNDLEEAKKWYEISASLGSQEAKDKLNAVRAFRKDDVESFKQSLSENGDDLDGDDGDNAEFDPSSWSEESYLKSRGYTVSKQKGLSDDQRQRILANVIDSGKMSKYKIIDHLEAMISLRKYQSKYRIAISKWERDIDFVRKYRG